MPHSITAVVLKGGFDAKKAAQFDLFGVPLGFGLTLFHIDHYYSACWQHQLQTSGCLDLTNKSGNVIVPSEIVIYELLRRIAAAQPPQFALLVTDYFGGVGSQYANVFHGPVNADPGVLRISPALRHLGVPAAPGQDEFDTVGLSRIRSQPDWLEKYGDLAEEYGV